MRGKGEIVVLDKRGLSSVIAKILSSGASWPVFEYQLCLAGSPWARELIFLASVSSTGKWG